MTTSNKTFSDGKELPIELAQVLAEEFKHVRGTDVSADNLHTIFKKLYDAKLTALCFSGGGIRSATFGLGIVQSLAKKNLLDNFDYLSTVSGGGYLGSWLSAWILRERVRIGGAAVSGSQAAYDAKTEKLQTNDQVEGSSAIEGFKDVDVDKVPPHEGVNEVQAQLQCLADINQKEANPEPPQLQHLREYSNYMSPKRGLLSADTWTLIAIYVRNLFLNLTIFIPLMAAVLMLPRLLASAMNWHHFSTWISLGIILASIILGGIAIGFVLHKLPSKNPKDSETPYNTDAWVLLTAVVPLLLMATALATVWAGSLSHPNVLEDYVAILTWFKYLPTELRTGAVYFIVGVLAVSATGYVFFSLRRRFKNVAFDGPSFAGAVLACVVAGVLLWFVPPRVFDPSALRDAIANGSTLYFAYVCFSVPLFLLIYLAGATVFVGLTSGKATDEDREWLARYGAWILIVSLSWIVVNSLVLFGPKGIEYLLNLEWDGFWNWIQPIIVSVVGVASAVISLAGGFSSQSQVRDEPIKTRTSRFLAIAPKLAGAVFLVFIFVGLAYGTTLALRASAGLFASDAFPYWLPASVYTGGHREVVLESGMIFLLIWIAVLAVIGFFMAFFVNVNKFSYHGAYRDRLVRAYLGASNKFPRKNTFTGFDDADNFQLHRLKHQRPFHIINATLNLVGGKQLAWQNRKAASFTMSPLHCGSSALNSYRNTNEYCRNTNLGNCENIKKCNKLKKDCGSVEKCQLPGKAIRLGTAMAISGAAANPNMGYYSSSVVTFLMTLFNIRLGWWLGNTGPVGSNIPWGFRNQRFFEKSSPTIAVFPLLNETLGRTDENKRYINVTDGGHFENLALYEMVLRRCRFIILSDGAADESFKFGEIANAIQKCKVDLGVDIRFIGALNIQSRDSVVTGEDKRSRFALARITYPERDKYGEPNLGYILYVRPTYYGTTEPTDIRNYADSNERFPHQSTGDQMYDEKQFEAYRGLGFLTMEEVIATVAEKAETGRGPASIGELVDALNQPPNS